MKKLPNLTRNRVEAQNLFNVALKCAVFQCKEKRIYLTGVKIKDILGENVFKVICPFLRNSEFFAKFVALSNLLDVTDPYEIYQFLESLMNTTEANAETRVNSEELLLTSALTVTYEDAAKTTFRESVFTEDILPLMLNNPEILTVKDLLNFRLVNRCWRDVATSVLLKRNLGVIALKAIPGIIPRGMDGVYDIFKDINSDKKKIIISVIYRNVYQNKLLRLSELSQLISTSPKFPCNVIRFDSHFSDGIDSLSSASDCDGTSTDTDTDTEHQDLFDLVSLYGKKIKKLSLSCRISEKAVQNLLYVHMPHLNFLDIDGFSLKEGTHVEDSEPKMYISSPSTLELKEISVGGSGNYHPESSTRYNFVEELIRVSPNCVAIKKVNVKLLGVLLEMGKCHLIKDVRFDPTVNDMSIIQQFATLLTDSILGNNLPSLKLTISELRVDFYYFRENAHLDTCTVVHALNLLLSANKDSLKHLEFTRGSYCRELEIVIDLFIPPLPRLEHLYLDTDISSALRFNFLGDIIGDEVQAGQVGFTSDSLILQIRENCNIPANYFPNLRKMVLGQLGTADNSANLRQFFSLHQHLGPDGVTRMPGDTLLTVTSLVLKLEPPFKLYRTLPNLFPNVAHLELDCTDIRGSFLLQNFVWSEFPKLERFIIDPVGYKWRTKEVDSFFTGITSALCAKFGKGASSTEFRSSAAQVLERTQPYIGDCKNLKELTIKFDYPLYSKFVSEVTAVHGFQDVIHRTKIIFSFSEANLDGRQKTKKQKHFGI